MWFLSPAILSGLFLTQKGSGAEEAETGRQVGAEVSASVSQTDSVQIGSA